MFKLFKKQFSHKNSKGITYELWYKDVELRGGKKQRIYFFRKKNTTNINKATRVNELPSYLEVRENPRNGFLTVKRKGEPSPNYELDDEDDD